MQGKGLIATLLNDQRWRTICMRSLLICARTGFCFIATAPQAIRKNLPSKSNLPVKAARGEAIENKYQDAVV